MAHVLVTGGAGFIGSHLVRRLLERGDDVRVVDNFSTGKPENIAAVCDRIDFDVELIEGDLCGADICERAVDGIDVIFHEAAIPSVQVSVEQPVATTRANLAATVRLLDAAAKAEVRRFVYAGSSAVYGDTSEREKREDQSPQPLSPYAAQKLGSEYFCKAFYESFGLETVTLRYFNIFGARQDPDSPYSAVIPIFLRRMLAGQAPVIYGDGLQSRDFVHIDNVIEANLRAAGADASTVAGNTYNIACGEAFTLLDLVGELNAILKTSIEPILEPARIGDIRHSCADISRARRDLGYEVVVDFAEGLRRTVEHFGEATAEASGS